MADFSAYAPKPAPNGFAQANLLYAPNQAESERVTREASQITPYALDWLSASGRPDADRLLSPDELNARYGVDGYLSFSKPETQASADYKSRAAARRAYYDKTLSAYQLSGADSLWQSLKGGALDPIAVPTYFIGLGELKAGSAAGDSLLSIGRGRLMASGAARAIAENTLAGTALEGANYGFKTAADEDYDFGQAFDNLTIGAILGGGIGALGGHLRYAAAVKEARSAGVGDVIAKAAANHGEDAAFMSRMAQVESDFNTGAQSGKSSAGGLFQFTDPTWNRMGGGNKTDAALNADRAAQLASENRAALSKALGRPAEDWEVYLAHQQGEAGARKLLSDPAARAADIVGEAAVVNNGGRADMTAGEFADLWRRRFDGHAAADVPRPDLSGGLDLMSASERAGAFEKAMDDFLDDRPVDVAALLPSEPRELGWIDDGADLHIDIPARPYEPDVAVTAAGQSVPVRHAVVDMADLTASHSDDLRVNPDYPQDLQPRDATGHWAQAQRIAADLNLRQMLTSRDVDTGAPVIGRDGVVESGNGRLIALRRALAASDDAAKAYRAALDALGYDTQGMERPVLVRVNTSDMSHGERIRFVRDSNRDLFPHPAAPEPPVDYEHIASFDRPGRELHEALYGDPRAVRLHQQRAAAFDIAQSSKIGSKARDAALTKDADATEALRKIHDALFAGDRARRDQVEKAVSDAGAASLKDYTAEELRGLKGVNPKPAKVSVTALISADPELKKLAEEMAILDPTGEVERSMPDNLKPETVAEAMRAVAFCMLEGGV